MSYGDPTAEPRNGDTITSGPLTIKVGYSNGDFRKITIHDHLDRPLADGDVPYSALREIEARVDWTERVVAVVDQAHEENWGGKHVTGFCVACADAHLVAMHAVPNGPDEPKKEVAA